MRAAQIGSDGFLRDADGSLYGGVPRRPARPVRRAPLVAVSKPRPRPSGGLGQAGSELRTILDGASLGLPRPTPVSQLKLRVGNGGRSLMGDWRTEVYVGRFVFPSANIDSTSSYIVSARPAPRGMIRLMKIDGTNGTWVDFPVDPVDGNPGAVSFRRDFLVASFPAEMMAISLFSTFDPVFESDPEKKSDPMRASTLYCRAMLVSAVNIITSTKDPEDPNAPEPFSEADTYNTAERKKKALELAPRILTAFGLVDEAINSAGAGYDTRHIGMNALALLTVKTGVPMINELVRMWGHLADAVNTDQTEHYEKLGKSLSRYVVSSLLWGQYLMRALIFTNLTATSGPRFDSVNDQLLVACSDLLNGMRGREGEIAQLSGLTLDQVEKFKMPFKKFYDTYFGDKYESDKFRDEMLSKAGMDAADYELGYFYNAEALKANTRVIRQLLAPPSAASSLDPKVFKGLAGLEALGAGGGRPVPLRLQKAYRINKDKIIQRKKAVESSLTENEQRDQRELFYRDVYLPLRKMAEAELRPSEATIQEGKFLEGDRWKDPKVLKEILEQGLKPGAPEEIRKVARSLETVGIEGLPTLVEQASRFRESITAIEKTAATDPYTAAANMLALTYRGIYTENYSHVLAYSRTAKVKVSELADDFAMAIRKITPGIRPGVAESELAAVTFQAKLEETYGAQIGEMTKETVEYLDKQAKIIEEKLKEGEPSPLDPSVKIPVKNAEELNDKAITLRMFSQSLTAYLIPEGRLKLSAMEAAAFHEAEGRRIAEERKADPNAAPGEEQFKKVWADMVKADQDIKNYFSKEGLHSETILKIINYPKFKGEDKVESKTVEELKNALAALNGAHKSLEVYREHKSDLDYRIYNRTPELGHQYLAEYNRAKEVVDQLRGRLTNRIFRYEWKAKVLGWGKFFWNWTGGIGYMGPRYIAREILPPMKLVQYPFGVVTAGLAIGTTLLFGYAVVKILSYVPWFKNIFAPVAELAENGFTGVFGGADPNANNFWGGGIEEAERKKPLGIWGMAGLGVALAAILSPKIVIPFIVKTVSGVARGVGGIVGGKPGRGRPAGAKKPGIGPGAPPNVQKAISAIRRGREEGNPFLVKKGVEALKKAKAMGLPVPKGIID